MAHELSKFTFNATCAEYLHPWNDSCILASLGHGLDSLKYSLKLYGIFYSLTLLMKRKIPSEDDVKKTVIDIFRSSICVSSSFCLYGVFLCAIRRILGHFNFLTVAFFPSSLACLVGILIETPAKRTMRALWVANAATEALYKMALWREYLTPIPHGQVYIFAIGMSILMHFYRAKRDNKDTIFSIIRFVLGQHEEARHLKRRGASLSPSSKKVSEESCERELLQRSLNTYGRILDTIKARARTQKHPTCAHPQSCLRYVATSSAKMFALGAAVQLAMKTVFQVKKIMREPGRIWSIVSRRNTYDLAVFMGGFVGLYKLIACGSRRAFDDDSPNLAVPAALVASLAFSAYPSNPIALSVMWKALHLLCKEGIKKKKLPDVKWFPVFLFGLTSGIVTHCTIVEPQNLRSNFFDLYRKFSNDRLLLVNRKYLDEFGLDTDKNFKNVLRK